MVRLIKKTHSRLDFRGAQGSTTDTQPRTTNQPPPHHQHDASKIRPRHHEHPCISMEAAEHHRDTTWTPWRHQWNTIKRAQRDADTFQTPPRDYQDIIGTPPRHHQNTTETPSRHRQDTSDTPPRDNSDTTKTPPRSATPPRDNRDTTETPLRHHRGTN